jgi:hypothetical protein
LVVRARKKPAEIDAEDANHLISNTKKAVEEISSKCMYRFSISQDRKAENHIEVIFGVDN